MEEDSVNSMTKAISSIARTDESPEESGWTIYFEDFLNNSNEQNSSFSCYENTSLVSDAASSATKKFVDNNKVEVFSLEESCKNFSFKKRKTKGVLVDDALEDTASSPANSPKVYNLDQFDMNPKERDNGDSSDQEKGGASKQTDERSELRCIGRDGDCTELKKKGLRLVPLSMLASYLG